MKKLLLLASLVCLFVNTANALPVTFSIGGSVTTADRSANFDSVISGTTDLSTYTENSLNITVNDIAFIDPLTNLFSFGSPLPNPPPTYHYGSGGNNDYVSISGTDGAIFSAIDFLLGTGEGTTVANIQWKTYLSGSETGSGVETGIGKGQIVGWVDAGGFDELRVAAGSQTMPGFGNIQYLAIDDLQAQIAAVPVPAAVWLLGSALIGLFSFRRKEKV